MSQSSKSVRWVTPCAALLLAMSACGGADVSPGSFTCSPDNPAGTCDEGQTCSSAGVCTAKSTGSASGESDGGNVGVPPGMQPGTGGRPSATSGENTVCADVSLKARVLVPNVVLIVDQSGSMVAPFGSGTRWSVLKDALLGDQGIIAEFQHVVRFGIALFTYGNGDPVCPVVTPANLTIAIDALQDVRDVYMPAEPRDNTPTGESVDAVLSEVSRLGLIGPDTTDPTIFILATDGNPDTCALPDQGDFGSTNSLVATARSIEAVKAARTVGVSTYVIAVADENDLAQSHVNDLANAGVGDPAGPGVASAPSYRVDDDQGLRDALRAIVKGQQSCNVEVNGKVTGDACAGTVTLDGIALPCNDANGWKLLDESTIELEGAACTGVKAGKPLTASFPCDSVQVI